MSRYLSRRFFEERGNPKVHWDAGINALPMHVAIEKNIKLIFYAEHGESEYGGNVIKEDSDRIRDQKRFWKIKLAMYLKTGLMIMYL